MVLLQVIVSERFKKMEDLIENNDSHHDDGTLNCYGNFVNSLKALEQKFKVAPPPEQLRYNQQYDTFYPTRRARDLLIMGNNNVVLTKQHKDEIRPLILNVGHMLVDQIARSEYASLLFFEKMKRSGEIFVGLIKTLHFKKSLRKMILDEMCEAMKAVDRNIKRVKKDPDAVHVVVFVREPGDSEEELTRHYGFRVPKNCK